MAQFPAAGFVSDEVRTEGDMKTAFEAWLAATKQIPGAGVTETTLTIVSGVITPTSGVHAVDTESGASTDDLATIATTNLPDGSFLWLHPANSARDVVVKHNAGGAGQIALRAGADLTLGESTSYVLLRRAGADWQEVMSSGSGGTGDVRCQLRRSANLSVTNNLGTDVPFDVEITDALGMHDGTNPSRITVTASAGAGRYLVTGTASWDVGANPGTKGAGLTHHNGTTRTTFAEGQIVSAASPNDYNHINVTGVWEAAVGDYFEMFAYQRTGAALNLLGGAFGTNGGEVTSALSVVKLN